MKDGPLITVLCGGASPEADVSRVTGRSVADALGQFHSVELVDLARDELPESLNGESTIVFPAMHGPFGEDGQLQTSLEARSIAYAGCGPDASRLCMDKPATKAAAADCGFYVAEHVSFAAQSAPSVWSLIDALGERMVLKPINMGSSVGVRLVDGIDELRTALEDLDDGQWMAEAMVAGREMTVGLLEGKAMGLVEIRPRAGFYDMNNKYTEGATDYLFPASVNNTLACKVKNFAERVFTACDCRDFARLDFIITSDERPFLLEINTIPGMTPTSLLPKSASCVGLDFPELVKRMIAPAISRFESARATT